MAKFEKKAKKQVEEVVVENATEIIIEEPVKEVVVEKPAKEVKAKEVKVKPAPQTLANFLF